MIDEEGNALGVMTKDEALRQARQLDVDLVEVAANAKPPVCRLMDFKKFKYLEARKLKEEKKKNKEVEMKEIKLTPFMGEHDLGVRVRKIRKMLEGGHRIKLWVQFKGRQFKKKEYGYQIIEKMFEQISEIARMDANPKMMGPKLVAFISPEKKKKEKNGKKQSENKKRSSQEVQDNGNG